MLIKLLISIPLIMTLSFVFIEPSWSMKTVTVTPMTNEYFDKIYKVNVDGQKIDYLHVSCKEKNVLSISVTPTLDFYQNPKYPVFDQLNPQKPMRHSQIPRMQKNMYTFLSNCPVQIEAHSGGRINDDDPFITVRRLDSEGGNVIFTLRHILEQNGNYTKFETYDPSVKWGFGERFQTKFAMKDGTWSIYNRDRPFQIDTGSPVRSGQTYGHQPVYLARNRLNNLFHMVYFKNTFAFNFQSKKQSEQMTYHSTGGPIHFVIFIGEKNPETVVRHYHDYIGGIHVPPFWSMGWHQSRWGYRNLDTMKEVISEYNKAQIPIDTLWSDLDYMSNRAIFTIDETNYPSGQMKKFLQKENLHWVPLIDVGVHLGDDIGITRGQELDVFIKSNRDRNKAYEASVWPGRVHFVDYLHPNASRYWMEQLDRLYSKVPFSGVWLDMNEPSNFDGNKPISETYRIQHSESLNMMTIDNDLQHYCVEFEKCAELNNVHGFYEHREVHAYFGHFSTIPTHKFLEKHGRPFIISRSNSVGSGRFAGHWTGDNTADWDFLRLSVSGNFLFQIFGIQMVGADVCGFHGNTHMELCGRWMQVGSLYPFARSHNENTSRSQEPYLLGDTLKQTSRMVLRDRYSLMKQIYTEMVYLNGTGSLFRPIFFEFYEDKQLQGYFDKEDMIETEFLIGRNILSAPILESRVNQRKVYFPGEGEVWIDITRVSKSPTLSLQDNSIPKYYAGQSTETIQNQLPAPTPLFLRSGSLILTSEPKLRSKHLTNDFLLLAGLKDSQAKGTILGIEDYHNEENIKHCLSKGCTKEITLEMKNKGGEGETESFILSWKDKNGGQSKNGVYISAIKVWENGNQWRYSGQKTEISVGQGKTELTLTKFKPGLVKTETNTAHSKNNV